ncbi:uncharacterized protein LOC123554536 isoform X2 [Mercenaria mercenaria]|nr:uncharacterized protein LOC123554536 isoform X2 [Mercenaria mercenaria]
MKEKKSGKNMDKTLMLLKLTTIVLLAIFIAMVTMYLGAEHQGNQMEIDQTLCVSCDQVDLTDNISRNLRGAVSRHEVQGSYLSECCGKTSVILYQMVVKKLQMRKNRLSQAYIKCSQNPSAQMNGIVTKQSSGEVEDVIHWNTTLPSFLKGGIGYRDSRLTVSNTGYYFVYFQIQSETSIGSDDTQRHSLYRIPSENGEAEMLLETFKPKCEAPTHGVASTSNIGAVFYLKAHDELFVNTSQPENLVKSISGNYFGLFMT